MVSDIDAVDGVKWTISMSSLLGPTIPDSMIPDDIKSMLQGGDYELCICLLKVRVGDRRGKCSDRERSIRS